MIDGASKITLLKSSIALQLNPDLKLNDRIQLNQALTSSDSASAKMTIAIGPYKHREQPFQLDEIDILKDWNRSDFHLELDNTICQRNQQFSTYSYCSIVFKGISTHHRMRCDFAKLVTPTEAISTRENIPIRRKILLGWSPSEEIMQLNPTTPTPLTSHRTICFFDM